MYQRTLVTPRNSFFLFGPRATGKSTWIDKEFSNALKINLLLSKDFLALSRNPGLIRQWIDSEKSEWVIVDEVQKLPILLDEIHQLIYEDKAKFVLTGSSARKIKKENGNMLAGRASAKNFFTLTSKELNFDFNVEEILAYGNLPQVHNLKNINEKIDYLESYATTYLKEEVQQEALVRNLSSFQRFLEITSILNGQVLNSSNVARETGVARSTIDGYFSILQDTLLGIVLPGNKLKAKIKEVSNPKFYFFDQGVARALSGQLRDPLEKTERGFLLENWILNELRAYISYLGVGGDLSYWGTPSNNEVDFIWKRGKQLVGFEIKSSKNWAQDFNIGLNTLLDSKKIQKGYGVYLGEKILKADKIEIYPLKVFFKKLWNQELF